MSNTPTSEWKAYDGDDSPAEFYADLCDDDETAYKWVTGAVHCVDCENHWVAVVPAVAPYYSHDTGALNLLECPECGKLTGCSE